MTCHLLICLLHVFIVENAPKGMPSFLLLLSLWLKKTAPFSTYPSNVSSCGGLTSVTPTLLRTPPGLLILVQHCPCVHSRYLWKVQNWTRVQIYLYPSPPLTNKTSHWYATNVYGEKPHVKWPAMVCWGNIADLELMSWLSLSHELLKRSYWGCPGFGKKKIRRKEWPLKKIK